MSLTKYPPFRFQSSHNAFPVSHAQTQTNSITVNFSPSTLPYIISSITVQDLSMRVQRCFGLDFIINLNIITSKVKLEGLTDRLPLVELAIGCALKGVDKPCKPGCPRLRTLRCLPTRHPRLNVSNYRFTLPKRFKLYLRLMRTTIPSSAVVPTSFYPSENPVLLQICQSQNGRLRDPRMT